MTNDHGSDGDGTSGDQLSQRDDWEALARFVSGESSPSEKEAMRRLLEASPDDAAVVAAMQRALGHLPAVAKSGDIDVDAAYRRVSALRQRPAAAPLTVSRGPDTRAPGAAYRAEARRFDARRRGSRLVPAIAAAAAAVLAIGIASWRSRSVEQGAETPTTVVDAAQTLRTDVWVSESAAENIEPRWNLGY